MTLLRYKLILLSICLSFLVSGCQSNPSSDQLLVNILSADDSRFDPQFYEENTITIKTDEEVIKRTIKHWSNRTEGNEKYEISVDDELFYIFIDQHLMTFYKEDTNEAFVKKVVHTPLGESPIRKSDVINVLENLRKTHSIKLVREDELRGISTYQFEAFPKNNHSLGEVSFWIDQKSWKIVKYVQKLPNKIIESVITDYKPQIETSEGPKLNNIRFKYDFDHDAYQPLTVEQFEQLDYNDLLLPSEKNLTLIQVHEIANKSYKLTYAMDGKIHSILTIKKNSVRKPILQNENMRYENKIIFPIPTVGTFVQWSVSSYQYELLIFNDFQTEKEIMTMLKNFK